MRFDQYEIRNFTTLVIRVSALKAAEQPLQRLYKGKAISSTDDKDIPYLVLGIRFDWVGQSHQRLQGALGT